MTYDYVIIGGGIYGLYLAKNLSKTKKVLLLEYDKELFTRASYVNQARLHNGYHYPRSYETASTAAAYYDRFKVDFKESINSEFEHIYAIAKKGSKVDATYFENFCDEVNIPYKLVTKDFFKKNSIEQAYSVTECSFDYKLVKDKLLEDNSADIKLNSHIIAVTRKSDHYELLLNDWTTVKCSGVFNTTYSSTNQIIKLFDEELFDSKYQICEMILCENPTNLEQVGITVMDGLYFSLMPFGKQNIYSLSSVQYTPHYSIFNDLPKLPCQKPNVTCNENQMGNCSICPNQPKSRLPEMVSVVNRFMKGVNINYIKSIFSVKILNPNAEKDDNRLVYQKNTDLDKTPFLVSVFSGKISSIYELDELIEKFK